MIYEFTVLLQVCWCEVIWGRDGRSQQSHGLLPAVSALRMNRCIFIIGSCSISLALHEFFQLISHDYDLRRVEWSTIFDWVPHLCEKFSASFLPLIVYSERTSYEMSLPFYLPSSFNFSLSFIARGLNRPFGNHWNMAPATDRRWWNHRKSLQRRCSSNERWAPGS